MPVPDSCPVDGDSGTGEPDQDLLASLRRMGLLGPDDVAHAVPLTGGVSSDIQLIETGKRRFCVKRALSRLKTAAAWEAPVGRNAAEVAWMRCADAWLPGSVPEILGEDREAGLFAMTYLDPSRHPVWKTDLMAGRVDDLFAARVGRDLAAIHRHSAADPAVAAAFAHDETFGLIRLDPYLGATGRAHPGLQARFDALADRTRQTKRALMHGDVSPKNILAGPAGPVFLDAECACYGDPAFDLAFCLNHLLLKGARPGADRTAYLGSFTCLAAAYLSGVTWEDVMGFEGRAAALLPALLLARIDGTSPVEYLTGPIEREAVRRFAIPLIENPPARLQAIAAAWSVAP